MRPWTLAAAIAALVTAVWWHLPAAAQRAATLPRQHDPPRAKRSPSSNTAISDCAIWRSAKRGWRGNCRPPVVTAAEKTSIERRKAYYDQLAAMPEAERDAVYRERFDEIDTNHDGTLDVQERAAWREKQRETYRQQAAGRTQPAGAQR